MNTTQERISFYKIGICFILGVLFQLSTPLPVSAQVDTLWTRVLYEPTDQSVISTLALRDGGILVLGETGNDQNGIDELYLMKLDSLGSPQSQRVYDSETLYTIFEDAFGGEQFQVDLNKLYSSADGISLIVGSALVESWGEDDVEYVMRSVLLRLDIDGSLVSMIQMPDRIQQIFTLFPVERGYILVCSSDDRIQMMKTDLRFREIWSNTIGDSGWSAVGAVAYDSSVAITGFSRSEVNHISHYDPILIRAGFDGRETFSRCYEGDLSRKPVSITRLQNNGIALVGNAYTHNEAGRYLTVNGYIGKFDSDGGILFEREYPGLERANLLRAVETEDGGLASAGITGRPDNQGFIIEYDAYFLRIDGEGNITPRTFILGGEQDDQLTDIHLMRDGGCILLGTTESFNARQADVWLIKTPPDPSSAPLEISPLSPTLQLLGFPNPFNSQMEISVDAHSLLHASLSIYDVSGRKIGTILDNRTLLPGMSRFGWKAEGLPAGQYFIELKSERGYERKSVCIVR